MSDIPRPQPTQITGTLAEVLLRNPESYIIDDSGNEVHLVPDPDSLMWHQVPFVIHADCDHCETICYKCVGSWNLDHYLRFTDSDGEIHYSSDFPFGIDS